MAITLLQEYKISREMGRSQFCTLQYQAIALHHVGARQCRALRVYSPKRELP
jgi:hypothetical protein